MDMNAAPAALCPVVIAGIYTFSFRLFNKWLEILVCDILDEILITAGPLERKLFSDRGSLDFVHLDKHAVLSETKEFNHFCEHGQERSDTNTCRNDHDLVVVESAAHQVIRTMPSIHHNLWYRKVFL